MPLLRRPAGAGVMRRPSGAVIAPGSPPQGDIPTGPESGTQRGCAKQYCWAIIFSFPYDETIVRLGIRTPAEYTRETWHETTLSVHAEVGIPLVETAVFLERHLRCDSTGVRLPHLNVLVRCDRQYRWRNVAETFRLRGIRVDFSKHIKNWFDGVVYYSVASDHKPESEIDRQYFSWARSGTPIPLQEVIPPKWHSAGRTTKLSPLQLYDMFTKHEISDAAGAWSLASKMAREDKDRGLLSVLLEHKDVDGFIAKVRFANTCGAVFKIVHMMTCQCLSPKLSSNISQYFTGTPASWVCGF